MNQDFDDLAGDEFDFEEGMQDDGEALSLLLAEHPANEGAAIWD